MLQGCGKAFTAHAFFVHAVSIRADCETAKVYFLLSKLALRWIQSDAEVVYLFSSVQA